MYDLLAKKGQLFAVILGVIVIVIFLGSVFGGLSSGGYDLSDDLNQIMKANPEENMFTFFNPGLMITGVLVVIGLALALGFGLWQLISDPKGSLKGIIGIAVIALVFFALYATANSDLQGPIGDTLAKFDVGENISKLISGGLGTSLLLAGAAVVAMIAFEIYNSFK